jgi:DNA processing protein
MTPMSPNTQVILLLTAPLIVGKNTSSTDLLSPGEYKRLARHLRDIKQQPADLISADAGSLLEACQPVVSTARMRQLLGRGFLLSQVIERWQARAIWVVSRADAAYPSWLKARLREDAPAVLYGCGDMALLETGGLAVVGSRHVDDELIEYTMRIGHLVARTHKTLISGGAKGIDQAAMRGAIEGGGRVAGVLADSLEKTAMNRENRNLLLDGQLVLLSPYDPSAGFNVGHAMQRNKLIYALADATLVVNSDVDKGGTWAGAVEQLDKLRFVPVFVRSTGAPSGGLDALQDKGAIPWPNPEDSIALDILLEKANQSLFEVIQNLNAAPLNSDQPDIPEIANEAETSIFETDLVKSQIVRDNPKLPMNTPLPAAQRTLNPEEGKMASPADILFAAARSAIMGLLKLPMKDAEVAEALNISTAQTKVWLQRLIEEDVIQKQKKPACYFIKGKTLL